MPMLFPLRMQLFAADPDGGAGGGAGGNPGAGAGAGDQGIMVPKYRLDEALQRAQTAEAQVADLTNKNAELEKQVGDLKTKDEKIATLEKQLADEKAGRDADKLSVKREAAISNAIRDKVVDEEVFRKLIDMDKITFNDKDEVQGLDEQIKALQENKAYLFKPAKQVVKPGDGPDGGTGKTFAQKLAEERKAQLDVEAKSKNYF